MSDLFPPPTYSDNLKNYEWQDWLMRLKVRPSASARVSSFDSVDWAGGEWFEEPAYPAGWNELLRSTSKPYTGPVRITFGVALGTFSKVGEMFRIVRVSDNAAIAEYDFMLTFNEAMDYAPTDGIYALEVWVGVSQIYGAYMSVIQA